MSHPTKNNHSVMIIDDELHCREAVRYFVNARCPDVQIVCEAGSLEEAQQLLPIFDPDILLLDITLEDGTGFDLLDQFPDAKFRVVFITEHDDFALKAFWYSAIDYLLKPIDPDELEIAIKRAAQPFQAAQRHLEYEQLRHQHTTKKFDCITLNTGDGLVFIKTDEIIHLEANGNYSFVFLENGERHLAAQSLTSFEEILSSPPFFRVHQSHMINTKYVRKLLKGEGDSLQLTDQSLVPLSRRRKDDFMKMIQKYR